MLREYAALARSMPPLFLCRRCPIAKSSCGRPSTGGGLGSRNALAVQIADFGMLVLTALCLPPIPLAAFFGLSQF